MILRETKGSPLTHEEMDSNFRSFIQPITANDNITQHRNNYVSVNAKSFITISFIYNYYTIYCYS